MKKIKITCVQLNAKEDWRDNLHRLGKWLLQSVRHKNHLIALPENFYYRGHADQLPFLAKYVTPQIVQEFCEFARRHSVALLLGSLVEISPVKGKYYNTSILISEKGKIAARYRKMHLFDVHLKGKISHQESKYVLAGQKIAVGKVWGIPMGLTICYDLRFPELFRRLTQQGVRILFVPANFTEPTGKAHWDILLRARAIENQAFIVAPAQVGIQPSNQIKSYGHSLIVNPWGDVLAEGHRSKEQRVTAVLDLGFQDRLRKSFPVLKHRRL